MDKWCETIVWQSYPECKPEKAGVYIVKFANGETGGAENINGHFNNPWGVDIIAYAVMPTGSIGDEFGFETALLLMKEGKHCKALADNPRFEYHFINENGKLCVKDIDCIFIDEMLPLEVIIGKWRLA